MSAPTEAPAAVPSTTSRTRESLHRLSTASQMVL